MKTAKIIKAIQSGNVSYVGEFEREIGENDWVCATCYKVGTTYFLGSPTNNTILPYFKRGQILHSDTLQGIADVFNNTKL